jgi:hypothetical protein
VTCGMHGRVQNALQVLLGKLAVKSPGRRLAANIKIFLKKYGLWV